MSNDQTEAWRDQMDSGEASIKSCGHLGMATYMPEETTLGRVTSDRVRYVYFEDGSECIVLGKFCDFVAFKAADYGPRITALEAENAQLAERLRAADYDRERAFMALPITPNPQMAFGGLIYPHAVRVADEFAFRTAQNQEHERAIARLEAQLAEAKALNAEMYAALKAVEWGGSGDHPLTAGEACCPSCGSFSDDHEEGCLLDAALAKAQGREVSDEG